MFSNCMLILAKYESYNHNHSTQRKISSQLCNFWNRWTSTRVVMVRLGVDLIQCSEFILIFSIYFSGHTFSFSFGLHLLLSTTHSYSRKQKKIPIPPWYEYKYNLLQDWCFVWKVYNRLKKKNRLQVRLSCSLWCQK